MMDDNLLTLTITEETTHDDVLAYINAKWHGQAHQLLLGALYRRNVLAGQPMVDAWRNALSEYIQRVEAIFPPAPSETDDAALDA